MEPVKARLTLRKFASTPLYPKKKKKKKNISSLVSGRPIDEVSKETSTMTKRGCRLSDGGTAPAQIIASIHFDLKLVQTLIDPLFPDILSFALLPRSTSRVDVSLIFLFQTPTVPWLRRLVCSNTPS